MNLSSPVSLVRARHGAMVVAHDRVATEEPLEVRLHGRPFAVIMRTPGDDLDLAAGFLFAERVVRHLDELGTIAHCRDGDEAVPNVVNVTLAGPAVERMERALDERRAVTANSACGICGRTTIDSLQSDLAPLADDERLAAATLLALPKALRAVQPMFEATGGLHAAGLFNLDGRLVRSAEDVGRHNAVDKVVGQMLLRDSLPASAHVLFVSGRTSFEILQKAWCAGIPAVASISAPSSLAVDLAQSAGITLVGFVRDDEFNIYAHPERVRV
jgi:FdhD protein